MECGYFTLGETDAETVCKTWDFAPLRDDAITAMRWAIDRVKAGVYWPPTPKDAWTRDYGSLFLESPEQSVNPGWISDQEARISSVTPAAAHGDVRPPCLGVGGRVSSRAAEKNASPSPTERYSTAG